MPTSDPLVFTPDMEEQFRREGYLILERVVPEEQLRLLHRCCDELLAEGKATIDNGDNQRNHKFLFGAMSQRPALRSFVFSDLYAEICRRTLGPDAWFINDQYSYKDARTGGEFPWHQDGAYVGAPHLPYLTTWVAMIDMTEANGTIRVVPRSRAKTKETVQGAHSRREPIENHIGDERGIAVEVPAGSMAIFSSTVFHQSMPNTSDRPRAAYIVQFGPEAVCGKPGVGLHLDGQAFLKNGLRADDAGAAKP